MTDPRGEQEVRAQDARFDHACPTCGGALAARIGPAGVWTWCSACLRLSRPVVMAGPEGPVFMHPAAAA